MAAQQPVAALSPSADTAPLELVVLGSGGPGATGRAGSSYLVLVDGVPRILIDAGPGSFARLGEAKLSLAKTDIVLLTHLHIDHAGELPGLLKARAVSSAGPITFNVFGPGGRRGQGRDASFPSTTRFVNVLFGKEGAFGYLRDFSASMAIKATDVGIPRKTKQRPDTSRCVIRGRRCLRATECASCLDRTPMPSAILSAFRNAQTAPSVLR